MSIKRYTYLWSEAIGGYTCDNALGAGLPMVLASSHDAAIAALQAELDACKKVLVAVNDAWEKSPSHGMYSVIDMVKLTISPTEHQAEK